MFSRLRQLVFVVCGIALPLLSGCAVYMATNQPPKRNLAVLKPGTDRDLVIAELGAPVETEKTTDGTKEIYTFVQGYSKMTKASRALFHGTADLFTIGLWEAVGTPIECAFDGKRISVCVYFDQNQRVTQSKTLSINGVAPGQAAAMPAKAGDTKFREAKVADSRCEITVDGDLGAVLQALQQSAAQHGGQLMVKDATSGTYAFDWGSLAYRVDKDRIIVTVTVVAVGPDAEETAKRRGSALVTGFVEDARRDSKLPLHAGTISAIDAAGALQNGVDADGTAANPKWREYGRYLQLVERSVQQHWDDVVGHSNVYPPIGSFVMVSFVIAPDGTITRFSNVANHSTKQGEQLVLGALSSSAPFRTWSDDMKAKLNPNGEEVVFTFYYQ